MPRILFRPLPSRRRTTWSRHQRFFLSVVGELGFHYNAVERALLVERGRRGRVEAVRAVVAAGAVSQPMSTTPRSVCCRTLARHRHWTSSRSRISAARSAHLASVSRPGNRVAPRNRPSPGISSQSQVRFRSGHCEDRNGMVPALLPGSLLFYFCQLIRHVCLLVFLLVSATIADKNLCKFR